MVTYNPKDWLKLILKFHKSDSLRQLAPALILMAIFTAFISYIEQTYLKNKLPNSLTLFHQIAGFVISLTLVFRINTAYDRWWEGRKAWGNLLNNCRNLLIKLNTFVPENEIEKRKTIVFLISSYAFVLKEHLRGNKLISLEGECSLFTKKEFESAIHKPNFIASQLTNYVYKQCLQSKITSNEDILINKHIVELTDICGACERIKNTPIPFSYSIFIKKIVFIYIVTMPFTFGLTTGYWSVLIVVIMFYAFASLELISEEIEDPFGTDDNDLPLDEIADKIKNNANELLLKF
jgi:putative membrane protein